MQRPDHIPQDIWTIAKQSGQRNGSYEQTVKTAEMLMRRDRGEPEEQEPKLAFYTWLNKVILNERVPSVKGE